MIERVYHDGAYIQIRNGKCIHDLDTISCNEQCRILLVLIRLAYMHIV